MGLFLTIIIAGVVVKYFDEILALLVSAGAVLFWGTKGVIEVTKEMRQEKAAAQANLPPAPEKKRFWTWKKFALIAVALFLIAIH